VLNRLRDGHRANLFQHRLALLAVGVDAHLDQLVALEAAVDLRDHRRGQPVPADDHDRIELVGATFQHLALRRR
jgi:hypothetical protein